MLRVLLVGEPYEVQGPVGGVRRCALALSKSLGCRGDLEVVDPRRRWAERNRLRQAVSILWSIVCQRPQVVHLTSAGLDGVMVAALKPLVRFKMVVTVHALSRTSSELSRLPTAYQKVVQRILEAVTFPLADIVVVPSRLFYERALQAGYRFNRWAVVPHGVEHELLRGAPRERPPSALLTVFGVWWSHKGADRIPRILRAMPAGMQLQWVGNMDHPAEQAIVREFVRPFLGFNFMVRPPMAHDRVFAVLDQTAVLLVPSHFETFGIIVLEAAARGVPAVVSSGVGIAEAVKEYRAGSVIDYESEAQISDAICRILCNYREYSAGALRLAAAHSWDRTADEYVRLYRSLSGVGTASAPCRHAPEARLTVNPSSTRQQGPGRAP